MSKSARGFRARADRLHRTAMAWWGRHFAMLPRLSEPRVGLFCDCEGHFAGPAGEEFADRGLERLLDLFDHHGMRITFNVVADLCRSHPERIRRIADAGHEIACHGWRHERPTDLRAGEIDQMLASAVECFASLGQRPVGFRSPQSAWSAVLVKSLPRHGFQWNAERDRADGPYRIHRSLIRLPVAADDWRLVAGKETAATVLQRWSQLLNDARTKRSTVCLGMHEWVIGQHEDFATGLDAFLSQLTRSGSLQIQTLSQLGGAR
jgi:peptidoglycan/xylan/chitin deacetylase (PgdA/CDA1 family)